MLDARTDVVGSLLRPPELLEAQERLFPAQNAQAEVRLNRLVAYVQLYKALGGGWQPTPNAGPAAPISLKMP